MPDTILDTGPIDIAAAMSEPTEAGSVRSRVQQRRRELEQQPDVSIVLPLPGYEDLVAVQYRPLGFREMWKLESRHAKNPDGAEQVLLTAADKMIAACEQILEIQGENDYVPTGHVWNARAAREYFGCDIPDNTPARAAVLAVFRGEKGEEDLAQHVTAYEEQRQIVRDRLDRRVEGESEASSQPS